MKTIFLLGILVFSTACKSTSKTRTMYQSGNWICERKINYSIFECTNILTLDKVDSIYNATNIIKIRVEKN